MDQSDEQNISRAIDELRKGRPVAIPTETVYGLAAPIDDPQAIRRIFELKERPFFDPLIVHIASIEYLPELALDNEPRVLRALIERVMETFWPGPLTCILPKQELINPMITSGLDTIGVRMPSHPLTRELLQRLGVPLAAPSANKFGKTSPSTASHVRETWSEDEVFVLDGGPADIGIESTVIRFGISSEEALHIEILRKGDITARDLKEAAGTGVRILEMQSDASPGHTPFHYMPERPLVIVEESFTDFSETQRKMLTENLGLEVFHPAFLRLDHDPVIAARNLYSDLRSLSKGEENLILVRADRRSREGAESKWSAIWDRIERASSAILTGSE